MQSTEHLDSNCCEPLRTDLRLSVEMAREWAGMLADIIKVTNQSTQPWELVQQPQHAQLLNYLDNHAKEVEDLPDYLQDEIEADTTVAKVREEFRTERTKARPDQAVLRFRSATLWFAQQRAILNIYADCEEANAAGPSGQTEDETVPGTGTEDAR